MDNDKSTVPHGRLPALRRSLEAVEFEHEGKPMILIRDQEGLTDQALAMTFGGFLIATLLDGQHTAAEIQTIITKTTGVIATAAEIESLVAQLDKADLLETPHIQEKRKKVLQDFLASPLRKAHFMGSGYPKEPMDLALQLGKYFRDPKGPQKELSPGSPSVGDARGLISPHIDLSRGGPAYAWAYQALSEWPVPDAVVALGVAHLSPPSPWVATKKAYETPYGAIPVDEELFGDLRKSVWYDPAIDEYVHRTEHSLEFQALWLKYLWRDKIPAWLPVLCSSFYAFSPDRAPSHIQTIEGALRSWGDALGRRVKAGQRILILMGVDLAHVGPRFGDDLELNQDLRTRVETEDKKSLDLALQMKAEECYLSLVSDKHWRKICGLSAIYTGLRLLNSITKGTPVNARLLTYGQGDDPMGGIVSFASAIFSTT